MSGFVLARYLEHELARNEGYPNFGPEAEASGFFFEGNAHRTKAPVLERGR
jgi:hypothetical protein